ncbi:MAG: hypothetical protein GY906_11270, partial [bacterium]|nr:hypothetical protein [bacterium]
PPLAAYLSGILIRPKKPDPYLVIALNAALPGTGLAALGRPFLETLMGVLLAQFSLLLVGRGEDLAFYVPFMLVGGFWAFVHTPLSPLDRKMARPLEATRFALMREATEQTATSGLSSQPSQKSQPASEEYSVIVRCTECGADVDVPVLQRMVRCTFCGSDHLVVGQDHTLHVSIPERISDESDLVEVVLDHYRYQHYLKLYQRHVAPLERQASECSPSGQIIENPQAAAAARAAEAVISRKADSYRASLTKTMQIKGSIRFLAPYRHGIGTLYQTAFGREKQDGEKALVFAIANQEAATLASKAVKLPKMGKLSYLRALLPAQAIPEEVQTLPLTEGRDSLTAAYGDLDAKRLVRDINVIRHGNAFIQEVDAIVWRSWWVVSITAKGLDEGLLVDVGAGSVAGPAPPIDTSQLVALPKQARNPGASLGFLPMECPVCGYEFQFDNDAALHFCTNCHRVFEVTGEKKSEISYDHTTTPKEEHDFVPFWRFPLRLHTADGEIVTDLMFLKDGIDGKLDQIGEDAVAKRHSILVPAIRCINSKLMVKAFNQLLRYTLRARLQLAKDRFDLDEKVEPLAPQMEAEEARLMAPLYLANLFGRRDLARVNVNQVTSWLFDARLKSQGRLTYVAIPRQITEPFRRYLGRYHGKIIDDAMTTTH